MITCLFSPFTPSLIRKQLKDGVNFTSEVGLCTAESKYLNII